MEEFMTVMNEVSRTMKAHFQRALQAYGVHAGQQFILKCLWEEEGLAPGEIAERLGLETPTVSRAVQRMERAGFVQRQPDPADARLVRVYLTDSGRSLEQVINTVVEDATRQALADFSAEEQATLVALLRRLQRNLVAKLN
ncbi:MAG: MarR family transcriptional regulator [Chloroflexi bacterium]|nr:MarR family transcriptional regulator [Chloroflexota bacterium]